MAFVTEGRRLETGFATRLRAAYHALRVAFARRRVYARTVSELRALNTRELADIGITPCDIRRLAREEASKL